MENKDTDMGNLRQRSTLLEENIKLKREQSGSNDKMDALMSSINDTMGQMLSALNEIKNKEPVVVQGVTTKTTDTINETETSTKRGYESKPFIPSSDTSGMKMNVSTIQKKKRDSNLTGAADALSKLQNEGKK